MLAVSYAYNGLGERLQQTVNGVTTTLTVDLSARLSQVLSDGTNTYIYGLGRIAQESTSGVQYFLADALGSVRQLVDANGSVQAAKSYEPYGDALSSTGNGVSNYGFAGEWTDVTELIFLRARYYDHRIMQFIQQDNIELDPTIPADWNRYAYVRNNPINAVDPSGKCIDDNLDGKCDKPLPSGDSVFFNSFYYIRNSNARPPKLLVDYWQYPWNKYIDKAKTPHQWTRIPVRHPLNLNIKFWQCLDVDDRVDSIKQLYMSDNFYNWEVNARNIIGEMKGIIGRGEETALRDAIGIAYIPYNRASWNRYVHSNIDPNKKSLDYDPYNKDVKENYYNFKAILISGGQFAVGSSVQTHFAGSYIGPASISQSIYELAIIIAYGVDKRYFKDTSFGATEFRQRPDEYKHLGISGPTFFYKSPETLFSRSFARTSEQLWAQQGWDY